MESGCGQRQVLEFAVLRLQAGFEFGNGLPGFYGGRTGDSANDARNAGLLMSLGMAIQAEFGFGFHEARKNVYR